MSAIPKPLPSAPARNPVSLPILRDAPSYPRLAAPVVAEGDPFALETRCRFAVN